MFRQSSYYFAPTPKIRTQPMTPLTALFLTSSIIFMLTLLVGLWAAYDLGEALLRFSLLVSGLAMMVGLAWVGRSHPKSVLSWGGIGCAFGAAALGLAYGLRFIHNSGAVASGLMVLLPLAVPGVWWQWVRRRRLLLWVASGALAIALIVFLVTFERTAWIGLVMGSLGAAYSYWRFGTPALPQTSMRRASGWVLGLGVLIGLLAYSALLFIPSVDNILSHTVIGAALVERIELWRESLALCREYYFTGSGLGMTTMVYSTYVLAMRVPYWYHAHNLYLQLALEQGVPGLLAFIGMALAGLGMTVVTYQNSGPYSRWFCLATITALVSSLAYGLLDAELYATSMVATMFVPLGFALALYWAQLNRQPTVSAEPLLQPSRLVVNGAGVMPVIMLVVLCTGPGAWEKFYTNLGVLTQTKVELSRYHWSIWSIQDELRRKGAVDLSTAITYYEAALALNPHNATAHQRLGQIALSQGDYSSALEHLKDAYNTEPERNSLHRLLGEAYAVTGNVNLAAALWQSVHMEEGQIEDRLWWYGHLNAEQEVHWLQQALAKIQL